MRKTRKEDIKALLDRRKNIKGEINRLEKEYTAIGNVIEDLIREKERSTDDGR